MPLPYTRFPAVEGYPDKLSYLPGETVAFHCTARTKTYTVEIARIGAERELVWRRAGIAGQEQPFPADAYATGCGWPVSFSLSIPETWRSGYYEVLLQGDGVAGIAAVGYACFVVRAARPSRGTASLLVLSTNTYNAYNQWGGSCLYAGARRVSFARPFERGFLNRPETTFDGRIASIEPAGEPAHQRLQAYQAEHKYPLWSDSSGWHNWERRFVRWAERNGYHLDYAINADLEFHPEVLDGYQLLLSVGHDEYWSWGMRDTVDGFVERGGNHAIFSGNTCFWQVRYEDEGRTMVCYKSVARQQDPVMQTDQRHLLTALWSDPLIQRPENLTTGLSFCRGGYIRVGQAAPRASGAYTVYRPEHWVFANTDLRYGDLLGLGSYIATYEVDGCELTLQQGRPVPTHTDSTPADLAILATAPARLISITETVCEAPPALWESLEPPGELEFVATQLFGDASPENVAKVAYNHAVMGVFTKGKGTVFNAGVCDWAYGLDNDPLVQQVTHNILARLSNG
ncbi:MAG: hypothetical protein NT075_22835 [Chloroflexi bacterium]|nr:hypothetical protein [Chloroflexota bacterium]